MTATRVRIVFTLTFDSSPIKGEGSAGGILSTSTVIADLIRNPEGWREARPVIPTASTVILDLIQNPHSHVIPSVARNLSGRAPRPVIPRGSGNPQGWA